MTGDLAAFVDRVVDANAENVDRAAAAIVRSGRANRFVWTLGAGHSLAAVLETFFRAGGLAFVRPIWQPGILPLAGARVATAAERVPGSGRALAGQLDIDAADTVVVFSNSGVNPLPVEAAQLARGRGATVVAMTSRAASAAAPPRASARLADVADIVLDTEVPPGDASWPPEAPVTAPLSSLATTALWTSVLRRVHDRWPAAPRWRSANMPGTDDENAAMLERFAPRIPEL